MWYGCECRCPSGEMCDDKFVSKFTSTQRSSYNGSNSVKSTMQTEANSTVYTVHTSRGHKTKFCKPLSMVDVLYGLNKKIKICRWTNRCTCTGIILQLASTQGFIHYNNIMAHILL